MKLRSLFLASLAAMAMVSCSNEDQIVNNGGQPTGETATLEFSIAFPSATDTRALSGTVENEGTSSEQKFNEVYLALQYQSGAPVVHKFGESDFSKPENGARKANKFIDAVAGAVKVYVFVNPSTALAGKLEEGTVLDYTSLLESNTNYAIDCLTAANGIAQDNHFLMTGNKDFEIVANQPNEVSVAVDRVAAKLEEQTSTDAFTIARNTANNKYVDANNEVLEVRVKIENYAYVNLNTTTYVVKQNAPYAATESDIFQYFNTTLPNKAFTDYSASTKAITGVDAENIGDITYCNENSSTIPTSILYQGQIQIKKVGADYIDAPTLYVNRKNNVIYLSFDEANKATNGALATAGLSEGSSFDEFAKYGFEKFVSGLCYYNAPIETANANPSTVIYRNNWYKLYIKSLADLGLPVYNPSTTDYPTLFMLGITTNPWLVSTNGFEL